MVLIQGLKILLGLCISYIAPQHEARQNTIVSVVHPRALTPCSRLLCQRSRFLSYAQQLFSCTSTSYRAEITQTLLMKTHSLGGFFEAETHAERSKTVVLGVSNTVTVTW